MPANNHEFVSWLRYALKHLYDPSALEDSPLIQVFGLTESETPAPALRQLIITGIHSLEPDSDVPDSSPLWSIYEILLLRFIQQCPQLVVADRLNVSGRHLRRKEREATVSLAHKLQARLDVSPRSDEHGTEVRGVTSTEDHGPAIDRELAWLGASNSARALHLASILTSALRLVRPMADAYGVELTIQPLPDLPPVAVDPVGLRQILVSLLSMAIRHATAEVSVEVRRAVRGVAANIRAHTVDSGLALDCQHDRDVTTVQYLVQTCGGDLKICTEAQAVVAELILPVTGQVPVLVIDDNVDLLGLMKRYASGTRYHIRGASSVQEALTSAAQVAPQIIVLDVMMPDIDGWEVLGRLRNHPLTRLTTVIVCTILPEKELAYCLGADGFIQKPFSQSEFLSALDHQNDQVGQEAG